jgi:hypothetical protein
VVFLCVKINSFSNIFNLHRKSLPCLKRKIGGFIDSDFGKTCHEHVTNHTFLLAGDIVREQKPEIDCALNLEDVANQNYLRA